VAGKPFHAPFGDLKRKLAERKARDVAPPSATSTPASTASPTRTATPASDGDLWAEATSGVRPLARGKERAAPPEPRPAHGRVRHPDDDALEELRALVEGDAPFDISDGDEFVEGCAAGLDPAILRKLRRGEYAVQGHVDLHGLTREEARAEVARSLREARAAGKRCVLLVHGRGLHSRDQVPVLKEALRSWLAAARFGRHVLAFATARPEDGGAGALYVLLRRAGR
jgi:DNA-nicking Smr family endonuclease